MFVWPAFLNVHLAERRSFSFGSHDSCTLRWLLTRYPGRAGKPCLSVGVKSKAASSSSSVARTGLTEENEDGACHEEEDAAHIYSFGAAKVAWRHKEKLVWPAPDARC